MSPNQIATHEKGNQNEVHDEEDPVDSLGDQDPVGACNQWVGRAGDGLD